MSYLKPTKSSTIRNEEKKKVIINRPNQGRKTVGGKVTIDRSRLESSMTSNQPGSSSKLQSSMLSQGQLNQSLQSPTTKFNEDGKEEKKYPMLFEDNQLEESKKSTKQQAVKEPKTQRERLSLPASFSSRSLHSKQEPDKEQAGSRAQRASVAGVAGKDGGTRMSRHQSEKSFKPSSNLAQKQKVPRLALQQIHNRSQGSIGVKARQSTAQQSNTQRNKDESKQKVEIANVKNQQQQHQRQRKKTELIGGVNSIVPPPESPAAASKITGTFMMAEQDSPQPQSFREFEDNQQTSLRGSNQEAPFAESIILQIQMPSGEREHDQSGLANNGQQDPNVFMSLCEIPQSSDKIKHSDDMDNSVGLGAERELLQKNFNHDEDDYSDPEDQFTIGKVRMKKDERMAIKQLSQRLTDVEPISKLHDRKDKKIDNDDSGMFHLNLSKSQPDMTAVFHGMDNSQNQISFNEGKQDDDQDLDCLQNVLQKKIRQRSQQLLIKTGDESDEAKSSSSKKKTKQHIPEPILSNQSANQKTFNYELDGQRLTITDQKQMKQRQDDSFEGQSDENACGSLKRNPANNIMLTKQQTTKKRDKSVTVLQGVRSILRNNHQSFGVASHNASSISSAEVKSNDSFQTAKHANKLTGRQTVVQDRSPSPDQKKRQSLVAAKMTGEDDIETANFEVESQKQQDQGRFIAESFANFANQSLCFEQEQDDFESKGKNDLEPQDSILFNAVTASQVVESQESPIVVQEDEESKNAKSQTNSPEQSGTTSKYESVKATEFEMIDKQNSSINQKNKQSAAKGVRRYEFSFQVDSSANSPDRQLKMLLNTTNDKKSTISKDQKTESKRSGGDEDLPVANTSRLFVIEEDEVPQARTNRKSQKYLHDKERMSVNSEEDEEVRRNEVSNQLKNISPIKFLRPEKHINEEQKDESDKKENKEVKLRSSVVANDALFSFLQVQYSGQKQMNERQSVVIQDCDDGPNDEQQMRTRASMPASFQEKLQSSDQKAMRQSIVASEREKQEKGLSLEERIKLRKEKLLQDKEKPLMQNDMPKIIFEEISDVSIEFKKSDRRSSSSSSKKSVPSQQVNDGYISPSFSKAQLQRQSSSNTASMLAKKKSAFEFDDSDSESKQILKPSQIDNKVEDDNKDDDIPLRLVRHSSKTDATNQNGKNAAQRKSFDLSIAIPQQEEQAQHEQLLSQRSQNKQSKSTRNLQSNMSRKQDIQDEQNLYESITAFNALQTPRDQHNFKISTSPIDRPHVRSHQRHTVAHRRDFQTGINKDKFDQVSATDDGRSTYSKISRVSKMTHNILNKSNNAVNDQWYQYLYNNDDDLLNDSDSEDGLSQYNGNVKFDDDKSQGAVSRFTLRSKLSNAADSHNISRLSHLQSRAILSTTKKRHSNELNSIKIMKSPIEKLNELLDNVDLCRFFRVIWLLNPIMNPRTVKARVFNLNQESVQRLISEQLKDSPIKQAMCYYFSDDLMKCLQMASKCRMLYCKQKKINRKQVQFDSYQMTKCYLVELATLIELMRFDHQADQPSAMQQARYSFAPMSFNAAASFSTFAQQQMPQSERRTLYRKMAWKLLDEIPLIVKSREQHLFTIIEVLVQHKEKRALSKLKDLDFISYKLLKLERSISLPIERQVLGIEDNSKDSEKFQGSRSNVMSQQNNSGIRQPRPLNEKDEDMQAIYLEADDDEKKMSAQEYCEEIQRQFSQIDSSHYIKKIEFFIFGALSAFKNQHFVEAWNFISQAPFICNFGDAIADIETLVVFEILKMVEIKLLTKIGRPEHAIIQLSNRFFRSKVIDDEQYNELFPFAAKQQNKLNFETSLFVDNCWCLYKQIRYNARLIEFRQDLLKYKMVSMLSDDFNKDALLLQKTNNEFCNLLHQIIYINDAFKNQSTKSLAIVHNNVNLFQWLLVKLILRLEKSNKCQQMMSNDHFVALARQIDLVSLIQQLMQHGSAGLVCQWLSKRKNHALIEEYLQKYALHPTGQLFSKRKDGIQEVVAAASLKHAQNLDHFGAQHQQNTMMSMLKQKKLKKKFKDSFEMSNLSLNKSAFDKSQITTSKHNMVSKNSSFAYSGLNEMKAQDEILQSSAREKELANLLASSETFFYIQLNYILEMVDLKLNYAAKFPFYYIGKNFPAYDNFHQKSQGKKLKEVIQKSNYFDKMKKSSFYQKTTKYLSRAVHQFLQSSKMIIFQNIVELADITEYLHNKDLKATDELLKNNSLMPNQKRQMEERLNYLKARWNTIQKGRNTFRAFETLYHNQKLMFKQNEKNKADALDKSMNDVSQMNPYISDDKSAMTGLYERKKNKQMALRDDQVRFGHGPQKSHNLLNDMSMDSMQYNMSALGGAPSALNEHDNLFDQHLTAKGPSKRHTGNILQPMMTGNFQVLDQSDLNSESQFEGGGREQNAQPSARARKVSRDASMYDQKSDISGYMAKSQMAGGATKRTKSTLEYKNKHARDGKSAYGANDDARSQMKIEKKRQKQQRRLIHHMKLEYFNINEMEPDNKSAIGAKSAINDDQFDNKSLFERRIGMIAFNKDGDLVTNDKKANHLNQQYDCSKSQMIRPQRQNKQRKKHEAAFDEEKGFVLYDEDGPAKDEKKSMLGGQNSEEMSKNARDSEVKHSSGSKILQNRPQPILIGSSDKKNQVQKSRHGHEPQTTMNVKLRNSVVLGSSASYSIDRHRHKKSRGESVKTDRENESRVMKDQHDSKIDDPIYTQSVRGANRDNRGTNHQQQLYDEDGCNMLDLDGASRIAPSQVMVQEMDDDDLRVRQTLDELNRQNLVMGSFAQTESALIPESAVHDDDESSSYGSESEDQNVSVSQLVNSEQEKINLAILSHSIYEPQHLLKLCMACCLGDAHLGLAIRIINVLFKCRREQELKVQQCNERDYLDFLELILAYIYLRLNQQQFMKQSNSVSKGGNYQDPDKSRSDIFGGGASQINTQRVPAGLQELGDKLENVSAINDTLSRFDEQTQFNAYTTYGGEQGNKPMTNILGGNNDQSISQIDAGSQHQAHIQQQNNAIRQKIMGIIQNQDYFLQQAKMHFRQFNVAKFLDIKEDAYDKKAEPVPEFTMAGIMWHDFKNLMTMMFLHVQNELCNYKQLRIYDQLYQLVIDQQQPDKAGPLQLSQSMRLQKIDDESKQRTLFGTTSSKLDLMSRPQRITEQSLKQQHNSVKDPSALGLSKKTSKMQSNENPLQFFQKLQHSSNKKAPKLHNQDSQSEQATPQKFNDKASEVEEFQPFQAANPRPTADFGALNFGSRK